MADILPHLEAFAPTMTWHEATSILLFKILLTLKHHVVLGVPMRVVAVRLTTSLEGRWGQHDPCSDWCDYMDHSSWWTQALSVLDKKKVKIRDDKPTAKSQQLAVSTQALA